MCQARQRVHQEPQKFRVQSGHLGPRGARQQASRQVRALTPGGERREAEREGGDGGRVEVRRDGGGKEGEREEGATGRQGAQLPLTEKVACGGDKVQPGIFK